MLKIFTIFDKPYSYDGHLHAIVVSSSDRTSVTLPRESNRGLTMDISPVESDVISGTDTFVVDVSLDESDVVSVEDSSVVDASLNEYDVIFVEDVSMVNVLPGE